MAQGQHLIWSTAKTRGQPPQGSALELLGEPGSQSPVLLSVSEIPGAQFAAGWGSYFLSRMDDTIWLTVAFFTSSLYSAPTPVSNPYHSADPCENGFQEESVGNTLSS